MGFTGGIVLNFLLVLDPSAFTLPAHGDTLPDGIGHAPAMLGAAFASLASLTASVAITSVGQLYVAIMIAGVLGKPRQLGKPSQRGQPSQTAAAPAAEHPQGRKTRSPISVRRSRC